MKESLDLPTKSTAPHRRLWRKLRGDPLYHPYFVEHRCIFIHIPKAAGTSIGEALFGDGRPGHRLAMDYRIGNPDYFDAFFKFTIVRNPYDRLVSAYHYLMQGGKSSRDRRFRDRHLSRFGDFRDFVVKGLTRPKIFDWIHFRPQYLYLVDFEGRLAVDYIGRLERLEADFREICDRLGIAAKLPVRNRSSREDYGAYYDEELRKIVADLYERDFDLLGYEKSGAR